MRDDLHKGMKLPRRWKRAFEFCLRPADEGERAQAAIVEALEHETRSQVSPDGLRAVRAQLEAPCLPFGNTEPGHAPIATSRRLNPEERRLCDLAMSRISGGECATPEDALRLSLQALVRERLSARRMQAESQLVEACTPQEGKEVIARLSRNSNIAIEEIVGRILRSDEFRPDDLPHRRIDPDEDLRK